MGCPSKRTLSASVRMSPQMVRSRVDLPAPFAPMMACVSPSSMRRLDVEEGLEMAVAGGDVVKFEQAHGTMLPM